MKIERPMDAYDSAGPIGSEDRQIPIDINELRKELNDEKSSVSELWAEYQIGEWPKKLGRYCGDMALYIFWVLVPPNCVLKNGADATTPPLPHVVFLVGNFYYGNVVLIFPKSSVSDHSEKLVPPRRLSGGGNDQPVNGRCRASGLVYSA